MGVAETLSRTSRDIESKHWFRLHAMIDPHSEADWGLNEEDREAISWAIKKMLSLRDDFHAEQRRAIAEAEENNRNFKRIRKWIDEFRQDMGL